VWYRKSLISSPRLSSLSLASLHSYVCINAPGDMDAEIRGQGIVSSSSEETEPAWRNLIPELLLALLGCGGGAFVYRRIDPLLDSDSNSGTSLIDWRGLEGTELVVSELVDWVSEAEREQLNRIVELGWYYAWLQGCASQIASVSGVHLSAERAEKCPYHVAVAQGCLELLDVYRQAVLKIEERLVEEGAEVNTALWSLLPLEQALSEFYELFPFLRANIQRMVGSRLENTDSEGASPHVVMSSPDIIEAFEQAALGGIPAIEGCSRRIVWHCYQVLFKQMHAWMVHGRLVDPSGEFFIYMGRSEMGSRVESSRLIDADIVASRLPNSISLPFARDVLFVGLCRRILDSLGTNDLRTDRDGPEISDGIDASSSKDIWMDNVRFEEKLRDIWASSPETLDWVGLKNLVHAQKLILSDRIWAEMYHTDRDLIGLVEDFVDIVLQNRGSLYVELVDAITGIAADCGPDPSKAPALASNVFREAAFQDSYNEAAYFKYGTHGRNKCQPVTMAWYDAENPECVVPLWHPKYDSSLWIPPYDSWDGLCIRYDLQWPMDLVFPLKAMRVYGALWQLMFRLSRALHELKSIRLLLRGQNCDRKTIALHHQLYHFLVTYATYLQEEIVACGKDKIKSILMSSTSVVEAEAKHMDLIANIVQTSFIGVKQVMGVLENVFVCTKSLVSAVDARIKGIHPAEDTDSIDGISQHFLGKYNVWYQLLQSNTLQSGKRGESVRRLLLSMNFNGFMDSNAARQLDFNELHVS
jgi:gamma-tubulin complex component 4